MSKMLATVLNTWNAAKIKQKNLLAQFYWLYIVGGDIPVVVCVCEYACVYMRAVVGKGTESFLKTS